MVRAAKPEICEWISKESIFKTKKFLLFMLFYRVVRHLEHLCGLIVFSSFCSPRACSRNSLPFPPSLEIKTKKSLSSLLSNVGSHNALKPWWSCHSHTLDPCGCRKTSSSSSSAAGSQQQQRGGTYSLEVKAVPPTTSVRRVDTRDEMSWDSKSRNT